MDPKAEDTGQQIQNALRDAVSAALAAVALWAASRRIGTATGSGEIHNLYPLLALVAGFVFLRSSAVAVRLAYSRATQAGSKPPKWLAALETFRCYLADMESGEPDRSGVGRT